MLKYLGYLIVGLFGFVVLMSIFAPEGTPKTADQLSYGHVARGGCMSVQEFNQRARHVIENNKWWPTNSATSTAAGFVVYLEMKRLGTPPCADLAPLYQTLLNADSAKP